MIRDPQLAKAVARASFLAAAELPDPPDQAERLAADKAHAPRLSCCGRGGRRATIRVIRRTYEPGVYEDVEYADCPTQHGLRELLEVEW